MEMHVWLYLYNLFHIPDFTYLFIIKPVGFFQIKIEGVYDNHVVVFLWWFV